LSRLGARLIWDADEPTMLTAARLKATHRLSLADAINAAFAIRNHATLVHKDPEYDCLRGHVDMEALPYKKKLKA
jgi:ribonuclease VapC